MSDEQIFNISHTKLSTFRRCRQQYHWKYKLKFYPPASMGQARGSAGHAALASWHVEYDAQKAMQAAWDQWDDSGYGEGDDWGLLERALLRYFPWSQENDSFKIITAEYKFEIEYETLPILFLGFIDGVVTEADRIWLLENKFNKRVSTKNLELDAQATLYLLAIQNLGKTVDGVIYNIIRIGDTKVAEKEPAVRVRLHRNKAGLSYVQHEVLRQAEEMLKYEREGGQPYRNPTRDCSWDCSYYQACLSMQDDGIEPLEILESIANTRKGTE